MEDTVVPYTCPNCQAKWSLSSPKVLPKFCPFCHTQLNNQELSSPSLSYAQKEESISFIQEHLPEDIQFSIGPYQVLKKIGTGGMGEVYLAYDTNCGRRIALKRIRTDLSTHVQLTQRFLREARITAQLTHPAIIPIYEIHSENNLLYYTMPYVEGKTLKEILTEARSNEKKGIKQDHISTIPSLIRIFLSVCQSIAYAHSKNVLHRDVKPNNIIIGTYGEVLILDWGLAKLTFTDEKNIELSSEETLKQLENDIPEITNLGKVVGTISYMAPERVLGQPATRQTDIYSLGVILYQILTLHHPFHRKTLSEFRKNIKREVLHDPAEIAPYRDIPPLLSRIALKCLSTQLEQRYHSVDELIHDLENYIEGRSEWFETHWLNIEKKADWEFQENILISEQMAISRGFEKSTWFNLMISKAPFKGNKKVEAKVKIGPSGQGVGFLISVPEPSERPNLNSGYFLWIGSEKVKSTKLLRSSVEVLTVPDVFLPINEWAKLRIEKIDQSIYLYINDIFKFSYISHLPLRGSHVGFLSQDGDFELKDFQVSVGSQNITVNCLAIPDAFFSHKDYEIAHKEYTRIAYSFPGTAEGREAMFRAGLSLLEWAKNTKDFGVKSKKIDESFLEFNKLHGTPGAPLEYLGKALIYQFLNDPEEEVKCFELAFRRYKNHPLLSILKEQMIHRMYESSHYNRKATYLFALITARFIPSFHLSSAGEKFFNNIKAHWEHLSFILQNNDLNTFIISLSFWLSKDFLIEELMEELLLAESIPLETIENGLFALIELERLDLAIKYIEILTTKEIGDPAKSSLNALKIALTSKKINTFDCRIVSFLFKHFLFQNDFKAIISFSEDLNKIPCSENLKFEIDCYLTWAYFYEKNWEKAGQILHKYPLELLTNEKTPLYFLYGCWLAATEGKDIALVHFSSLLEATYPRTFNLLPHFINKKPEELDKWMRDHAFSYEKKFLAKSYELFYQCLGEPKTGEEYKNRLLHAE